HARGGSSGAGAARPRRRGGWGGVTPAAASFCAGRPPPPYRLLRGRADLLEQTLDGGLGCRCFGLERRQHGLGIGLEVSDLVGFLHGCLSLSATGVSFPGFAESDRSL